MFHVGFENMQEEVSIKGKPIEGYDLYLIDINGGIYNKNQKKFIKPVPDKDGYARVILCCDGKVKAYQVHRLVANVYVPIPKRYSAKTYSAAKLEINHLDGDRQNNHKDNLEWCRPEENKLMMSIKQNYKGLVSYVTLVDIYKGDKDTMIKKYDLSDKVYDRIKEVLK